MTTRTTHHAAGQARVTRTAIAGTLMAMGVLLVFVVGFAHPQVLHDAAHDSRHALSFPCH